MGPFRKNSWAALSVWFFACVVVMAALVTALMVMVTWMLHDTCAEPSTKAEQDFCGYFIADAGAA